LHHRISACITPIILIQQNFASFVDRDRDPRNWTSFRRGFGRPSDASHFWIGNDALHVISTRGGRYSLRVEVQSAATGNWYWTTYTPFSVGNESTRYAARRGSYGGGTIGDVEFGDAVTAIDGAPFVTADVVARPPAPSADDCGGRELVPSGFWFADDRLLCGSPNLNGGGYQFRWPGLPDGTERLNASRLWLVCAN
jgi:hypothetical protein